jgi:hypothetical protein
MNAFKPRSPLFRSEPGEVVSQMKVETIAKELIEIFEKLGLRWEMYADEEGAERLYATGVVDGVKILVSCKLTKFECRVEAPEYPATPPCHSSDPASIAKCISMVVNGVKELMVKTEELTTIAGKLKEHGFKVGKSWYGVAAEKFIADGYIEVYFPYNGDTILKFELRTKSPTKMVTIAKELAELVKRLQL